MSFTRVRALLFQLHMWIGLGLGLLLSLLGLSGSAIVYDQEIANFFNPPPAVVAHGAPLSLDGIAQAARANAGRRAQLQISLPLAVGQPVSVRVNRQRGESATGSGRRRGRGEGQRSENAAGAGEQANRAPQPVRQGFGTMLYLDPVSGAVLGTRTNPLPPFLVFAHQLHGNFLMGRDGRSYLVGWLGVAMCILGLTGLVLWWPRRGQWKYAFIVRRNARGLRFHRELHAAVGIWIFVVFMAVSFSGVVLAWPQLFGTGGPGGDQSATAGIEASGEPMSADAALALALQTIPGSVPRSITLPGRDNQPVAVALLSHGAVGASVTIDPYQRRVIAMRDPSTSVFAWQRPVHQGMLGPIWRFLVFLSGFVPTIFVVTGVIMWAQKYRRRIAMNLPLAPEAAE